MDNNKPKVDDRLKDYIEVNKRIEEFWEKYPNGRLHTEIVSWADGVIVMKAMVYKDIKDQIPAAVGHAYEKEGSTFINKTSALENCETSCLGRAIAIAGFSIKRSIASKEEVANAMHQQEQIAKQEKKQQSKPEPDRTRDPALIAKWQLLAGSVEGWEDFVKKCIGSKGWTWNQVDEYLTLKIKERKQEAGDSVEDAKG